MNVRLRDPILVRSTSSRFLNTLLPFLLVLLDYIPPFPLFLSSPFLFNYLPSAYLFSAQLWNISGIIIFPFVITLVLRSKFLWFPSALHKILFLRRARLFYWNYIFQHQQIFNQLLPLLRGKLTNIQAIGTISDYVVHISASVAPTRRQGPCFPSNVHVHGDSHRQSGWRRFRND